MASQPRVLVIEDAPGFRQLMASLLQPHFLVTIAENGEEGYRLARKHPPHVVLIDGNLPGWNGLHILQKFQDDPLLSLTKTALLTGDASRRTAITGIQHGADEYIVKTQFTKEELLGKLQKLVAQSSLPIAENAIAAVATAETDPRLQELIDDWE